MYICQNCFTTQDKPIYCDDCLGIVHAPATVPQVPAFEVTPATFARPVHRVKNTIFIPLPKELWRKAGEGESGACSCAICKADGTGGYWDTIALSATQEDYERTWTVHYPELHSPGDRKAMAYGRASHRRGPCNCGDADHAHFHCSKHGLFGDDTCPGCDEKAAR